MEHIHHIVPKHMGGTDDITNLVELSIEEHAEAHRILWETYGKIEDKIAWQCLLGRNLSEEDRIMLAKSGFEKFMNDPSKKMNWIEKLKIARSSQTITDEHRQNISIGLKKAYEEGRFKKAEFDLSRREHMRDMYHKNGMGDILANSRKTSKKWKDAVSSDESKSKKRKSMKSSKRVIVYGIEYDSLRHAAKFSGISYSKLRNAILSNSDENIRLL